MKELLNIFRNRLLDLSASNRSVFLPKTYKGKFSDLKSWDFLSTYSSLDMVKMMAEGKQSFKIADVKNIRGEDVEQVLEETKRILRTQRLIEEETGNADFYVGWPFVEGVLKNGMPLRAPIAFFPYRLRIEGREVFLEKQVGGDAFWNRSLFLSLSLYESYSFDRDWLESPLEEIIDKPDADFRIALLHQLKTQGWNPSIERAFLSTNLEYFLPLKKEDLISKYKEGEYVIKPYAVMGLFPQSASFIHSDYDVLKKIQSEENIEQVFSKQYKIEDDLQTSNIQFTPLPVDGSQEKIISRVVAGESLLVQGPPGSGKTQLICNLIAQFLGKGKKVLVVCQKKAALDVVYDRLSSLELDSFVSLVHDAVSDRNEVYRKIETQITLSDEYKQHNIHPETIVIEKEFSRIQTAIARVTEFFDKYKEALYELKIGGETAHNLYLLSDRNADTVDLSADFRSIPAHDLNARSNDFEQYIFYYEALKHSFDLLSSVNHKYVLDADDKDSLLNLLLKISEFKDMFSKWEQEDAYLGHVSIAYAKEWLLKIEQWKSTSLIYQYAYLYSDLEMLSESQIDQWTVQVEDFFKDLNQQAVIPSEIELKEWIRILERIKTNRIKHTLFRLTGRFQYKDLWQWVNRQNDSFDLDAVISVLKKTQELYTLRSSWGLCAKHELEYAFTQVSFSEQLALWKSLYIEKERLFDIPVLARLWQKEYNYKESLEKLILRVTERDRFLSAYYKVWQSPEVDRLFTEQDYRNQWIDFIQNKFDYWLGHVQIKKNTEVALYRSFEKVLNHNREGNKHTWLSCWQQSILRAWIDEKERVNPVLKAVSNPEWNLKEQELQMLIERRYSISLAFLKIKLKEWVYADVKYNRLNRQVTYRDLKHQVNKKRSVWPLRKTIGMHEEEVLNLLPCWLVSPETASVVFPLHTVFDLVVFDEASQCFVEKAFPTLFRAGQVVVIGDDKQLKPNDLYRVRFKSQEEEEQIDYEVESLLDFAGRYLPSSILKGHYRSKSEALIRFSNEHFYNNELRVIPDIHYANQKVFQYIHVKGIWEANANRIEAEAVVDLVKNRLLTQPEKTLGVITFNYQQAFLIKELLIQDNPNLPAHVVVKNIENVQGDERDVIIFSIGYAKNNTGKMVTQFGSLGHDGGENRLNVAVTRAKEEVVVVASVWPKELEVDHYKHKGVQLLKAYMDFVYRESQEGLNDKANDESIAKKGLVANITEVIPDQYRACHFADLQDTINNKKLIFTDEQRYFYAPTVTDWHGYSRNMFTRKGWEVSTVYARNYWLDRVGFFKKLQA